MATIQLSTIPPIPSPGDKDFETKIGKVLSHMPTLATELKAIADATLEAATVVDVDGNATVAATAASQASTAAGNAMSAAGTAATHANTAKTEATKAARSKSDAALAASQSGTNAVAAIGAAERAEAAVLAAEAIAAAKAEEVATQAAADAATQAVSGVIAQAQASANAAATSATDANTAKNAAQAAATTAGQSVAAIATHAQTAQTASTAASNHAHNAGLRAAESLASAQQATSAGQAATAGAAQVLEILDNLNTGPVVSVNGKYGAVNLVKGDLGLSNVDNTSDLNKPISTATQTALAGKSDTGHAHADATTSAAGFMSAADKTKLDGVATNANNYSHPTGDGNLHVPATGTTSNGKVLTAGATAGSLSWVAPLALGSTAGTALGTAAAGTATTAARSDHVHPVQTSVSGNAGTATKLETARTINGVSFDGSANIDISYTGLTNKPTLGTAAAKDIPATGNASNAQVVMGSDTRLSDARTPTTHSHAISDVTGLQTAIDAKQPTLVSGTNIKTVNGQSLLGSGDITIARVSLDGPLEVFPSEVKTYTITDYSAFSTYAVSATAGTVSIAGNQITYTAPATAGAVTITVTRDGAASLFPLEIQEPPSYIATPAATPANFGDPFEGGFYAGMIWNQLTQSSTSKTLATGTQTFTVPSMTGAPIVYQGQTVEVRSRATPANKFVGTVTKAVGATLTINVTSIGGSGTFSDWSVMARHRIIVAPKASGENASIALKNANSAFPTACQTLTEGLAATQAMRDADTSTVYPAAHWARGLSIGGKADWYIPARDELELLWRNLKPVTNDNYITANRQAANYTNNGSFGDASTAPGTNKNSAPEGAAYTATTPGQTAATAFQSGGTEAFAFGSAYYWSSSEDSASTAYYQYWNSSTPGYQGNLNKANAIRVRAVRRSII